MLKNKDVENLARRVTYRLPRNTGVYGENGELLKKIEQFIREDNELRRVAKNSVNIDVLHDVTLHYIPSNLNNGKTIETVGFSVFVVHHAYLDKGFVAYDEHMTFAKVKDVNGDTVMEHYLSYGDYTIIKDHLRCDWSEVKLKKTFNSGRVKVTTELRFDPMTGLFSITGRSLIPSKIEVVSTVTKEYDPRSLAEKLFGMNKKDVWRVGKTLSDTLKSDGTQRPEMAISISAIPSGHTISELESSV